MGQLRAELRRQVFDGVSHRDLVGQTEPAQTEDVLRALATVPIRRPSRWERALGWLLTAIWLLLALVELYGVVGSGGGTPPMFFSAIISGLFAVHFLRGNGAVYGPSIIWLSLGIAWGWLETRTEPAAVADLTVEDMLFATLAVSLVCGMTDLLRQRLFPHVNFWGRHRGLSRPG